MQEFVVVLLVLEHAVCLGLSLFFALLVAPEVLAANLLHLQALESPDSLLLATADLGVSLLNDDHVGQLVLMTVVVVLDVLDCNLVQVVAQDRVVEINEFTQMRVHQEGPVVSSELAGSCKLDPHHAEAVSRRSSRRLHIEVDVFNVEHDELGQTLATANGVEGVLPVLGRGNLVRPHCLDVNHVHAGRHFVNQNKGADAPEQLLILRRQNDQVVPADGCQLTEIGVLVEIVSVLFIVRNELLVVLGAAHEVVLDELDQTDRVTVRLVLEVEALG